MASELSAYGNKVFELAKYILYAFVEIQCFCHLLIVFKFVSRIGDVVYKG